MRVTCGRCATKYHIADEAIGVNGRNVKCTKCSYIWFQECANYEELLAKRKIQHSGVKKAKTKNKDAALPVVIEYLTPGWFKLVPAFFMTLVVMTGLFVFQDQLAEKLPYFSDFYNKIGIPVTKDMILNGVEIQEKENNILDVNGFIVNNSNHDKRVPAVVINLVDKNNRLLSRVIPVSNTYLRKGEKHPFYKRIHDLSPDMKWVSVSVGDKYDMLH